MPAPSKIMITLTCMDAGRKPEFLVRQTTDLTVLNVLSVVSDMMATTPISKYIVDYQEPEEGELPV